MGWPDCIEYFAPRKPDTTVSWYRPAGNPNDKWRLVLDDISPERWDGLPHIIARYCEVDLDVQTAELRPRSDAKIGSERLAELSSPLPLV